MRNATAHVAVLLAVVVVAGGGAVAAETPGVATASDGVVATGPAATGSGPTGVAAIGGGAAVTPVLTAASSTRLSASHAAGRDVEASTARAAPSTPTHASRSTSRAQTTLELQRQFPGETDSGTVSFSFTADANETVDAPTQRTDGEVTFSFSHVSGPGASGSTFEVTNGEYYTVYYDVVGESEGQSGTDGIRSTTVTLGTQTSETLEADVTYIEPRFGATSASSESVLFEGESQQSTSVTVTFENDGQGDMNVADATADGESGVSASVSNVPNRINAGRQASVTVDVTIDESVNEGPVDVSVTLEDSAGNTETVQFSVEVRKATRVRADQQTYNVGGILRGSSETITIQIEEVTGYDDVDVSVTEAIGAGPNASASVSGVSGFLSAGGSETGELQISVNERSPQHEELSWTFRLEPTGDADAEPTTFTVNAETFYPAAFGEIEASSASYTFDEPRGESEYTRQIETSVENTGDLPLALTDVSVSSPDVDDQYVSLSVTRGSEQIPGLGSRDYIFDVTLDSRAPEGTHEVVIEYASANASAGTETVTTTVDVDHETQLAVDETALSFGQLEITRTDTRTIEASEVLGYNDIENASITRVSGPDEGWLTIERDLPSTIAADGSSEVVFGLEFDTDAEVLTEYEWTFRIDGEDVEPRTVTITAEPGLIDAQETKDDLSTYASSSDAVGESASTMTELLSTLESKIESGSLESGGDISRAFTAAQTYVTFLNATEAAQTHLEAGENQAAQQDLLRAASTYNTVSLYVSRLDDDELSELGEQALSEGNGALNEIISAQQSYYEERLASDDTSLLDAAIIERELARIAVLEGDEERANALQARADRAFESYASNVSAGQAALQSARNTNENMTTSYLTVIEGQPVLLNPMALSAFEADSSSVLADYETAQSHFEAVGASETAEDIAAERARIAGQYDTARTVLYVATGAYVLVFLGLVAHLVRGTTAYVADADEATSGDFLV